MNWTKESLDKNSPSVFGLTSRVNSPPVGWIQDDTDLKSLSLDGTDIVDVGMKGSKGPAIATGLQVEGKSFLEAYMACRMPADDGGTDAAINFARSSDGTKSWPHRETINVHNVPSTAQGQPGTDKKVGMDVSTTTGFLAIAFKRNAKHVLSIVYRQTVDLQAWQMWPMTVENKVYYGAIQNPKDGQGNPVVQHNGISLGDDLVITNEAPSLLFDGSNWFVAFGEHGGHRVYLGWTSDITSGSGWTFEALPGVSAAKHMGPGLTSFGDKVVVAWYDDKGRIFTSTYSPASGMWDGAKPVAVGGTQIVRDSGPLQLGYVPSSSNVRTLYLSYHYNKKARLVSTTAL